MTSFPWSEHEVAAVQSALFLAALPSSRRQLMNAPLPSGARALLQIAAGDRTCDHVLTGKLQRSPQELQEAAAFYIEQILLLPEVDSYRALGAERNATTPELRQNFVLICKWLHSDASRDLARPMLLRKVTQAWNDLKTPERRATYDASLPVASPARHDAWHDGGRSDHSTRRKRRDAGRAPSAARHPHPARQHDSPMTARAGVNDGVRRRSVVGSGWFVRLLRCFIGR